MKINEKNRKRRIKMKRTIALILAIIMALSLCACGSAGSGAAAPAGGSAKASDGTVTLRIGNAMASTHPWNTAIDELITLVDEYSGGRLKLVNYPDATLGSEGDMLQQVKEGTLDICISDPSLGTAFCKKLELFALPFLFKDKTQWEAALDGEAGSEYAQMIEDESGMKILAYWGGSTRNVLAVKKPVESIDDLGGFKLRLAASALKFKVWEAVGCLPVEIAFGETYSAMSSGLCDGMENENPSILSAKFYEVAPYMTLTEHEITVRPVFMNAAIYDSLDAELQQALVKALEEITPKARQLEEDYGKEAENTMVNDFGLTICDIDKQPIIEKVAPVFEQFGKDTGLTDLIAKIQAS